MSGEGILKKADKDYTKDVDKLLPEAESLAKSNTQAAIDKLLALEKQTRQSSDLASTSRLLIAIVTIAKDSKDWSLLNEQVLLLSKKHGQLRQAITKMVQVVMTFLDATPSRETKLSVIETLRTVTEGKIFVEVERARITRILSDIKKEQGELKAAKDILCELQVETFGSMSRREKTEFILEQVSLCIEDDDWTQASILSRKISTRYFARKAPKSKEQLEKEAKEKEEQDTKKKSEKAKEKEKKKTDETSTSAPSNAMLDEPSPEESSDDVTDLKLRYYEQQIVLAKHDEKYLDACKHYRQVLDTEAVENNEEQLRAALQRTIYFIILAPHDNEQSDLLHRIAADPRNATKVPEDAALLKLFTKPELTRWPAIAEQFGPHLTGTDIFAAQKSGDDADKAHARWLDLRRRVIEHNVRTIALYYTRITFPRLTSLLDLSEEETEKYISDLVVNKTIYAKIDRPARIVSFTKKKEPDDVLNAWGSDLGKLLGLLERVGHLIQKDEMMARIAPVAGKEVASKA